MVSSCCRTNKQGVLENGGSGSPGASQMPALRLPPATGPAKSLAPGKVANGSLVMTARSFLGTGCGVVTCVCGSRDAGSLAGSLQTRELLPCWLNAARAERGTPAHRPLLLGRPREGGESVHSPLSMAASLLPAFSTLLHLSLCRGGQRAMPRAAHHKQGAKCRLAEQDPLRTIES